MKAAFGRVQPAIVTIRQQFTETLFCPRRQSLDIMHNQPDVTQFVDDHPLEQGRGKPLQHRDALNLGTHLPAIESMSRTSGDTQHMWVSSLRLNPSMHINSQSVPINQFKRETEAVIHKTLAAHPLLNLAKERRCLGACLDSPRPAGGTAHAVAITMLLL